MAIADDDYSSIVRKDFSCEPFFQGDGDHMSRYMELIGEAHSRGIISQNSRRLLEACAEEGSYRAAAERLGIPVSRVVLDEGYARRRMKIQLRGHKA